MLTTPNPPPLPLPPSLLYLFSTAATIGFLQTSYTFDEDVGAGTLRVGVISGTIETDIAVQITTSDGTAICELFY